MANYFLLSSGLSPILNVVITSSFVNSPTINFSASLQASKSQAAGTWGIFTSSITSFNSMIFANTTITGSNLTNLILILSASCGVDIVSSSKSSLQSFVTSSDAVGLFSSCSISLL